MKQFKNILHLLALATVVTFAACQKEESIDPNEKGSLTLNFDNIFGNQNLILNNTTYKNAAGEDMTITMLNYFVSNVRLVKSDGTEYVVPQDSSYFLVKESSTASQTVTLNNVPAGDYKGVKFVIGVDSLRNTMDVGKRSGNLDIAGNANGMYWSWNSGYIFLKMEGTSPVAPLDSASQTRKFRYHIGGFGGMNSKTINNIKEVSLSSGTAAQVRAKAAPEVHILADASKVLNGTTNVSIATNATVMFNAYSVNVANNYASMFSIDHVHN